MLEAFYKTFKISVIICLGLSCILETVIFQAEAGMLVRCWLLLL